MICYCATLAKDCEPHYFYKFEKATSYILRDVILEDCLLRREDESYVYYFEDERLIGWVDIIKCEDV